jgi:Uma2 family endonuclease
MASPLEADRPTPTGAELSPPIGARPGVADGDDPDLGEPDEAPPERYDRSSLPGDYMVTIEGQTPEAWEQHAPEWGFCEYIDGVVYMPSPVSDRHQELSGFLFVLLDGFRHERGLGKVLTGPAVLRLSPWRKPEPDVFVRPTPEQAAPGGPYPDAPALLVVEVLSSNRAHDLKRKARVYRRAGIPELWYVDDAGRRVLVERRRRLRYRREEFRAGRLECPPLPGFWIDVGWLWDDPLPNPRRCLEAILAGPPADA